MLETDLIHIICGILFIIANLVIWYKGKIKVGQIIFLISDFLLIVATIYTKNWIGFTTLTIGLMLGILTFLKMNSGVFVSNLNTKKEKDDNV